MPLTNCTVTRRLSGYIMYDNYMVHTPVGIVELMAVPHFDDDTRSEIYHFNITAHVDDAKITVSDTRCFIYDYTEASADAANDNAESVLVHFLQFLSSLADRIQRIS